MSEGEQTVVKATARIDWRKLLLPSLLIMVLPTILAILLDIWFRSLPYITIVAIIICFPTATILVTRIALSEMDRVIAEVTPPLPSEVLEADDPLETAISLETEVSPESESGVESSSIS